MGIREGEGDRRVDREEKEGRGVDRRGTGK